MADPYRSPSMPPVKIDRELADLLADILVRIGSMPVHWCDGDEAGSGWAVVRRARELLTTAIAASERPKDAEVAAPRHPPTPWQNIIGAELAEGRVEYARARLAGIRADYARARERVDNVLDRGIDYHAQRFAEKHALGSARAGGLDHHALNWDGCAGVGDEGCVDESCYYCHSPLRPPKLRRLAQNLAVAGALCAAWELGRVYGSDPRMSGPEEWKPGCGETP